MKKTTILTMVIGASAGACATTHQSARVLAPGKTQVTAAVGRTTSIEEGLDEGLWTGDLQVRSGLSRNLEIGGRLVRTPGSGATVSYASADLKLQVVPERVSIAAPFGILWGEEPGNWEDGAYTFTPTLFVGTDLSPTAELVAAPRLFVLIPANGDGDTQVELGGSVGVRFTNLERTWAIHPELGLMHISENSDSETFLTFGVGVSVGN